MVDKSELSEFLKKIANLVKKSELKAEQDTTTNLQLLGSRHFCDKNHFKDDVTQNYSVFQPVCRYFKRKYFFLLIVIEL